MDLETIGHWSALVTDWSLICVAVILWRWVRYLHRRIDVLERRVPMPSLISGVDPAAMFDPQELYLSDIAEKSTPLE